MRDEHGRARTSGAPQFQIFRYSDVVPDPRPAPRDLAGEISARALRHCEPLLVANAAGFLVNSPVDADLVWTGSEVLATFADVPETVLVDRLYLPDSADYWQKHFPGDANNILPPFLEAFPEHGIVQIWSGLFVKTPPGIASWIRGPVNRTSGSAYSIVEGVIDTDWWAGPLFSVIRFNRTDFPVKLSRETPLLQVFAISRALIQPPQTELGSELLVSADVAFIASMIETAGRRNSEPPGSYRRVAARSRR